MLLCICCFGGCNLEQSKVSDKAANTSNPTLISTDNKEGDRVEYSNEKLYKDLITVEYNSALIDKLEERYEKGTEITFDELSKEFKFECIRKTGSKYYVILMEDDGNKTFLFFDSDLILEKLRRFTDFLSKDDFNFVKIGETTIEEVYAKDPNTHTLPYSSFTCTAHVVKEGGIGIEYEFLNEKKRVVYFKFYENSELLDVDKFDVKSAIPYILDIDKQ